MRAHETVSDLQKEGCALLKYLALDNENRVRIAQAGGVCAVLSAMRTNESNAYVQKEGCGALMNLASNDEIRAMIGVNNMGVC